MELVLAGDVFDFLQTTLLAGNHDPEMLLDDVRRTFEEAIERRGSVRYPDDEPLAPGWPGEGAGVFPLLLYLDPRVTLPFLKEHWGITERLLRGSVSGRLRLGPLFDAAPGKEASPLTPATFADVEQSLPALLADAIRAEAPNDPDALLAELQTYLVAGPRPRIEGTLAEHGGIGRMLLRAWLMAVRWAERFKAPNEDDGILDAAQRWLPEGLVALVAGHTHGPRMRAGNRPAYYNTGTWIPVGRLSGGTMSEVIDAIEAGQWEAEAPRTFVTVSWDDGPPVVAMGRCDAEGRRVAMEESVR